MNVHSSSALDILGHELYIVMEYGIQSCRPTLLLRDPSSLWVDVIVSMLSWSGGIGLVRQFEQLAVPSTLNVKICDAPMAMRIKWYRL